MKKLTNKDFIELAKIVHGDTYDYSKVEYINTYTKICITCPIHGDYYQMPSNHLLGKGCPICAKENAGVTKRTNAKKNFVNKSSIIHNNYYDYSKTDYVNASTKVCIICPEHGEFWQSPTHHLKGSGCPKCGKIRSDKKLKRKTLEQFINEANEAHNNYYDYSKTNYINNSTKICIICPKHGEFFQTPHHHLHGHGCPKCSHSFGEETIFNYLTSNTIKFIPQCKIPIDTSINKSGIANIDFYLPDDNIFIEYNGKLHYEPVEIFGGVDQFDHQIQRDEFVRAYCADNNHPLLEIPYTIQKELIELLIKDVINFNQNGESLQEEYVIIPKSYFYSLIKNE